MCGWLFPKPNLKLHVHVHVELHLAYTCNDIHVHVCNDVTYILQ